MSDVLIKTDKEVVAAQIKEDPLLNLRIQQEAIRTRSIQSLARR